MTHVRATDSEISKRRFGGEGCSHGARALNNPERPSPIPCQGSVKLDDKFWPELTEPARRPPTGRVDLAAACRTWKAANRRLQDRRLAFRDSGPESLPWGSRASLRVRVRSRAN